MPERSHQAGGWHGTRRPDNENAPEMKGRNHA